VNPFRESRRAWKERNFPEIERTTLAALALDRTLPELHFRLGLAQLQLGKHVEAIQALEACLERQPAYPLLQHARMARALTRARLDPVMPPPEPPVERADPISVIICSITPAKFDRVSANYSALLKDLPHEIVGIHDARSLAEGYNRGAKRAKGEILVFSHDDIEIASPDFAPKLIGRLSQFDLIGIAGTDRVCGGAWMDAQWPHVFGQVGMPAAQGNRIMVTAFLIRGTSATPMQALDGVFFATRRPVVEKIQFDESTFDGWHLYDLDFSYRVAGAGFRLGVCNDLLIVHQSGGDYGEAWYQYARKFMRKHFPASGEPPRWNQLEACTLGVNSADEWRSFTQYMISDPA
jgi:tetratricopeptide (TPR) repeat protein